MTFTEKLKSTAHDRTLKTELVGISARIPLELKNNAARALDALGLKWVDVFTTALEEVIEQAAKNRAVKASKFTRKRRHV